MRALAAAAVAVLLTGPASAQGADIAVTVGAHMVAGSCAVLATATITAYDTARTHDIVYHFVRSDGSASAPGHLGFSGGGAVAQSVVDTWMPRGADAWIALEITSPQKTRTRNVPVVSHCAHRVVAEK